VNNSIFYNYAANELIVKILYVGITLTLILLAGVIVYSILLIKAHKINTFAEIYSNTLVISVFSQAILKKFRPVYYKSLYVIKLSDIVDISIHKNNIVINSNARYIHDKAERLYYGKGKTDISFDVWWYDYNCTSTTNKVAVPDIFMNSSRFIKAVRRASLSQKARLDRRNKYHEQLMALASKPVKSNKRGNLNNTRRF